MPEISVIMGVYNCKNIPLLHKSVQSVIDQSFTDWEFLICNDGSTDNTLEELKKLELIDDRIKVFSYEKNQSLAYALNVCAKAAKGRFIARQDDDDISAPDRFEKQHQMFKEHPEYAIVGTMAEVFDDGGVWGEYSVEENPTVKSFLWSNPFAHPTVMMRTEALKDSEYYRISKETRRCEDYDLFMRMYAKGYIGCNIQEKLYKYRIINDNKKYRPMKYRVDEAVVRWKGYCKLGLMPIGVAYAAKPILIGMIPQSLFKGIRQKQYSKQK